MVAKTATRSKSVVAIPPEDVKTETLTATTEATTEAPIVESEEKSVIPETAAYSSVPKPIQSSGPEEWPEKIDEEEIWHKGVWSGLDQWTCLWKAKHIQEAGMYTIPCRQTFWSYEDLMAHIRDNH